MICDKCNFFCCHTYCDTPKLDSVPIDDWFCKWCRSPQNLVLVEDFSHEDSDKENDRRYFTRQTFRNSQDNQANTRTVMNMSLRPRRHRNLVQYYNNL